LAFIPTAVIQRGAQLFAQLRRWSDVIYRLKSEGNGTYARSTLIRRICGLSPRGGDQNSPELADVDVAAGAARAVVKTRHRFVGDHLYDRVR
jgi:hypothetical protein